MFEILAAAPGAAAAPPAWPTWLLMAGMIAIFWFLIIRPQMKQQKLHREKIAGIKKGDQVVTSGGIIGKVTRVDDNYADVEIAQGVKVKVVKATIGDIVPPGGTPAND